MYSVPALQTASLIDSWAVAMDWSLSREGILLLAILLRSLVDS
jgi:hypothetical protein